MSSTLTHATKVLLGTVVMAHIAVAGDAPAPTLLNSFETPEEIAAVSTSMAQVTPTNEGATFGKQALRVTYNPSNWPSMKINAPTHWDWSGYGGLVFDLTNPGTETIKFGVRVDDDIKANGVEHCRTAQGSIEAGKTASFMVPYNGLTPMDVGMRGLPRLPDVNDIGATGIGPFDPAHIVAWQIFLNHPAEAKVLIVDNVRLVPAVARNLDGIVDEFGQYTRTDWPGKLKNESEFATRRAAEEAELKVRPTLSERDRFGGWATGPQLAPSKFFRTEKINGRWWLVDPDGRLFFSVGTDVVRTNSETMVTGRESMFSWLPAEGTPLAKHFGYVKSVHSGPTKEGRTFDFYAANLNRKYGDDYQKAWLEAVPARLFSWGFNTIGNWSDQKLFQNGRMPYTATSGVGGNHARIASGEDYWGKMHDPFDPQFALDAANNFKNIPANILNDPLCIGYFVDNELSWGGGTTHRKHFGLAYGALAEDATKSFAKRAILDQLKQKYIDIAKLNAAWQTNFTAWDDLNASYKASEQPNPAMQADFSAFLKLHARTYFEVVRDELKKVDPNHLYLGCRFASSTPEAVEAAAEICDVLSFNIYRKGIGKEWDYLKSVNKPAIIGEFHFGALDRGMLSTGLVAAKDQQERAQLYQDYVRSVSDHPSFVGCHWFQWVDEALTGRSLDGENHSIGFVSVTDTPYPEMVEAARAVHAEIYPRHYGEKTR